MLRSILEDVPLAVRNLWKDRAFAVLTIVTLAVAIGANTAIFSVVDGVLFRTLPFPDAERVVTVIAGATPAPGRTTGVLPFSDRGYWHFLNNNRVFEAFGGYSGGPAGRQMPLSGEGQPLQVDVSAMTATAFEVLGALPQRGRLPLPEENRPRSADPDFWSVWTGAKPALVDWETIAVQWQGGKAEADSDNSADSQPSGST